MYVSSLYRTRSLAGSNELTDFSKATPDFTIWVSGMLTSEQ